MVSLIHPSCGIGMLSMIAAGLGSFFGLPAGVFGEAEVDADNGVLDEEEVGVVC
jgi:hypothetical protein